jgi:hypothetical protein
LLRQAGAIWLNHLCCIGLVREAWSGLIAAQPAGFGHPFAGFELALFWSKLMIRSTPPATPLGHAGIGMAPAHDAR